MSLVDLRRLLEPEVLRPVEEVARLGPLAAAAFDADGTLWSGDMSEDLLRELSLHRRLIDPPPGEDPYAVYQRLFAEDPPKAFAWCVEVLRGLPVADVERWSDELFDARFAARVFPSVRAVLCHLRAAGVTVYLVSAGIAATIRRAAARLGLDPRLVLAVEGALDAAGRFEGAALTPVTCGPGKAEALTARLGGRPLALAWGNSLFDQRMLELAERAIVVAPRGESNPATLLAESRGWPLHRVEP